MKKPIRDPNRVAKPEVLAIISQVLTSPDIRSAHYGGYAHEPVLRLLKSRLGTGFSVMDYWDRYGAGGAFFWEEGCGPCPERPEWLEGVPFYFEGFPRADLLIWDIQWPGPEAWEWLLRRGEGLPHRVLLIDEAREAAVHRAYTWTHTEACELGIQKPANDPGSVLSNDAVL